MRVLLRIRSDVEQFPGGDYWQLLKTKEGLESMGVHCGVATGVAPIYGSFDLVHIFNTTRLHEPYLQFRQAKASGLPVVCSTIWHSTCEFRSLMAHRFNLPWFPITMYSALREGYYARRSGLRIYWPVMLFYSSLQRRLVQAVDAVLPNSEAELRILRKELSVAPRAAFVIPNGVDVRKSPDQKPFAARDTVLCVGRIEPLKNQLSTLRAFRSLGRRDLRLVFYGRINSAHRRYWRELENELQPGWIDYGGELSPAELSIQYGSARSVVLASFFETTGLVVLEGLANGASAVVSHTPCPKEYFRGYANFCDPYDTRAIANAMSRAFRTAPPDVSDLISRYSWTEAARATVAAYKYVLESSQTASRVPLSSAQRG